MSTEELLKKTLDVFGIPVEQRLLYGKADELPEKYFTFSISRGGSDFADDEPGAELCDVSIHFLAPFRGNNRELLKKARKALHKAGFTWPSQTDATDSDGQHYILECQIAEGVEDDGEL